MIAFIVHGGVGDIPDEFVEAHRVGCAKALQIGWDILQSGGSSVDAVEKAINALEDDPTFDAGRGSHLNAAGEIELDASIMNGTTFRCGAVAAVQNIRNPISLARKVMDESEHILLVGKGAARFALEHGIRQCKQDELLVGRELERWKTLLRQDDPPARQIPTCRDGLAGEAGVGLEGKKKFSTKDAFRKNSGTVGAVALDHHGVVCTGTSTGGTPNKYPGRVGDSPLIGCGSYADSAIGGVSTTGWGEAMIKVVMAKTVIDLIDANDGNAQAAAEHGVNILKRKAEGYGGVIVLTPKGTFGVSFNTPRMARAYINEEMSAPHVEV